MATIEERAVRHREASLRYLAKPEAKARKKEYDRHRLETDPFNDQPERLEGALLYLKGE